MTIRRFICIAVLLTMCCQAPALFGQSAPTPAAEKGPAAETMAEPGLEKSLDQVLADLEKRYSTPGFTADFIQESTLKAMDITDTATGKIMVKRPGMMRWEYVTPEPQTIVTDGERLWIYRPDDNQVMVGKAPAFFKDGKGAGFLSDMKLLRKKFAVFADDTPYGDNDHHLKLIPEDKTIDLAAIFLTVDRENHQIKNIVTLNAYEDETRIDMANYNFDAELENGLFGFTIPEGVDILELEE